MKQITQQEAESFRLFVSNHDFFFISGHREPDGDAICSCLGVAAMLDYFSKPYQLLSAVPFRRSEISRFEKHFTSEVRFLSEEERKKTGLIIVDCSELSRLGDLNGDLKNLDMFIIDHHRTASCPEGSVCCIDETSPSTCNLVQQFYEALIGKLPQDIAEILFFGFCTDSGFFKFLSPVSANVFSYVGRMVEAGANPKETYDLMTGGKPFKTRKLLGVLLERTELFFNGKLALTYETLEDTHRYGGDGRDSDSLYQLLLSVDGVQAVVFMRQETPASCTGGFRSKGDIDVSAVAQKFGGGGHKNAAGMSVDGKLDSLLPAVKKEFARIL